MANGLLTPSFIKRLIVWLVSMVAYSVIIVLLGGGLDFVRQPIGVLYLVLWGVYNSLRHWGVRGGVASADDKNQRTFWSLGRPIMIAIVVVAPWEYANFAGPIPRGGMLAWLGLTLFAGGDFLQVFAMSSLRGLCTSRLGVQPGHRLVTNGPYRVVRHPGYLGAVLCFFGMGLAMSSLMSIALSVLFEPVLVWRIEHEEEMLLKEFGDEYRTYKQKPKRLIPMLY
jgi:protein-S-isoprenylcysteine O-methyltransferase